MISVRMHILINSFMFRISGEVPIKDFFIQFIVPFKIIETSQSLGGAKREYPGKTT